MNYTNWTTDELVKLQALVGAEDAGPEERDSIARELKRRQSAPAPAAARAPSIASSQTPVAPATSSDLSSEQETAEAKTEPTMFVKVAAGIIVAVIPVALIAGCMSLFHSANIKVTAPMGTVLYGYQVCHTDAMFGLDSKDDIAEANKDVARVFPPRADGLLTNEGVGCLYAVQGYSASDLPTDASLGG